MRFPVLFPVLLVAAILTAACDIQVRESGVSLGIAQGRASDEWVRSYVLPENGSLEIVNVSGNINVTAAAEGEIEVHAELEVRTHAVEEAQELLGKVEMLEDISPDRVRIEARGDWTSGLAGFAGVGELRVTYRVLVPEGLSLSLTTENGNVEVRNLGGSIVASTTNGRITGRNLSGAVDARVVNGGVQLDLASAGGEVRASATNGGVRLDLPVDAKATLDLTCVNGGIRVDDQLALQASESSRRHVAGTINGGGPRISLETVNGGIRVRARGAASEPNL